MTALFIALKWAITWLIMGGGHTIVGAIVGFVNYFGWAIFVA